MLSDILARFGTTDQVADGSQALAAVETALSWGAPPDLICLELRMPGPCGIDVLRAVRDLEEKLSLDARRFRVLMLASVREASTLNDAVRKHADGYLTKPVDPELLEQKLHQLGLG